MSSSLRAFRRPLSLLTVTKANLFCRSTFVMADPKPDAASAPAEADKEKQLPKLSAKEFAVYNHMAEHMDYFVSRRRPISCSAHS